MSRWRIHESGCRQVVAALGGPERIFDQYPYLRLPVFHFTQLETYSIACSYMAIMKPKLATRKAIENLTGDSSLKRKVFSPCPRPLILLLWDIGTTAVSLLASDMPLSEEMLGKRHEILSNAISFEPFEWVSNLRGEYVEPYM